MYFIISIFHHGAPPQKMPKIHVITVLLHAFALDFAKKMILPFRVARVPSSVL